MSNCSSHTTGVALSAARSPRAFVAGLAVGCLAMSVTAARSDAGVVYSNVGTVQAGYANGNVASVTSGTSTFDSSALVADDINFIAGSAGQLVNSFQFSIFNAAANTAATSSVNPIVRFYADDPTTGVPTTLLYGVNFNPITQTPGTYTVYTFTAAVGSTLFTIPADEFVWAGIAFRDGGTSTATAATLPNFGQAVFNSPTVGSSDDVFFKTSAGNTTDFNSDNPTGGFIFFGGTPVANFAWSFTTTAVPEPASAGLAGVAALAVAGGRRRRAARR